MKEFKDYFSKSEIVLWSSSVMVIIISFCVFDRINYMTLCASLIGVTSLIFNAKGNPFGQLLFEGKTIPCISLKGQKVFHSGYELRDKDKHDISILESLSK